MENKFIFVCGLHRSATTLIAKIISQHPKISGLCNTGVIEDEGQLIQNIYPTDNAYGGPGRFAFDNNAHLTEDCDLINNNNKIKLMDQWRPFWKDKEYLLEKSPPNIIKTRFLQEMFPKTYFIIITRHPIPTSIATYKWSGTGIYSLIHHWVAAHDIMLKDIEYLKRYILISYEEFMKEPKKSLKEIQKLLELEEYTFNYSLDLSSNEKYFDEWHEKYMSNPNRSKPIPDVESFNYSTKRKIDYNYKRMLKTYIRKKLFGEERQMSLTTFEALDAVSMFERKIKMHGYSLIDLELFPKMKGSKRNGNY